MEDSKTSDISDDDPSASQTIAHLDLSLVHQKAFPSFWNQVKYDTFPCNFFVLGFVSGSTTNLHVQGDGGGGILDVIPLLRSDQVQYCGFRISRNRRQSLEEGNETEGSKSNANLALKPYFVLLRWIGRHTSALQVQNLEKDLDFLKGYFHNATLTITVHESEVEDLENDSTLRKDIILKKVLAVAKEFNLTSCGGCKNDSTAVEVDEVDIEYDFMNKDCVTVCTHYDYDDEGDQASMSNDALYNAMRNFEKAQEDDERERAQALNAMDARYDPNLKNLVEEGEDGIMSESVETKYDDYGAKYTEDYSKESGASGVDPRAPQATSKPPRAPTDKGVADRESKSGNIMDEGFLKKLGKRGFLNEKSTDKAPLSFKDQLKHAATSYTDVDKLLDVAKQQEEELTQLEMERIKLSQQRMELYQEQASHQLELKRQAQHEKLKSRLAARKRRRGNASSQNSDISEDDDSALLRQHFSNNAQNRIKSKQRITQRIVERKLQSLEKKSMNGRTQLLNVEKSIKENKDMLDEINLRRSKDTGDELSIANHTKK